MDDKIIDLRTATSAQPRAEETQTYYTYQIHLLPVNEAADPIILEDYGYLISAGPFYSVCRGPIGKGELMTTVNADRVHFIQATGLYSQAGAFDA